MENEENKENNTNNESDIMVKLDVTKDEIEVTTEAVLNLKINEQQNESTEQVNIISEPESKKDQSQTNDIKEEIKSENDQNVTEEQESKQNVTSNADNNSTIDKNIKDKKKREVDPAAIPRKGYFFEHDDRDGDENVKEDNSIGKSSNQASNKRNTYNNNDTSTTNNTTTSGENAQMSTNKRRRDPKNRKLRHNSENNNDRWQHDKFDLTEQKPKTKQEIIKRYGYDIRQEKDTNKIKQVTNENNKNNNNANRKSSNKQDYSNQKNNEKSTQRRHSHNFEDNDLDEEDDELQRNFIISNNDDENIDLTQLRRRKPNGTNNSNHYNNNSYNKNNRHSLNVDLQERQTKSTRTFDNSKSKLKNLPTNSFKNQDQRPQFSQSQHQQQQNLSSNFPRPRTQPDLNAQSNNSNTKNDNLKQQLQQPKLQSQQNIKSDLKSFDQEIPKRYSTIRSNQRPLSGQFIQNKLFNNQPTTTSGISLDQNNFQHQFMFNSNNHSPVQQQQQQQPPPQQQQQTWPTNAARALTHHIQPQNTLQQHLNLQPPPGLSLNTQSTSSTPAPTSISQQQMAALINNQLYYMQPNDYMTQLTAAQEYAAAMAVLQTNQIYFTNQSLPQQQPTQQQQQQQQQMSPMSQLGIQRQSKAIPIVNPHQFNQRNF